MFTQLSERLQAVMHRLSGSRLTEKNIGESLDEVRRALLEADVALSVVEKVMHDVRAKVVGSEVIAGVTPGQMFIQRVHDELIHVMGEAATPLNFRVTPPAVILLAGLQGSGKTTSAAKLARHLKEREKKSVLLVSVDVYRPAAILQLQTLAEELSVACWPTKSTDKPTDVVAAALEHARRQFIDVVIFDTAGRLHIDDAMMDEVKQLHAAANPIETLFVIDSMAGQDAVNTAKAFHDALPLTGVVLTKIDGDARGGAALSVRHVTGCPIKFLGVGEKTDALEVFHPDRVVSRLLGMGDVLTLVEEAQQKIDQKTAEKQAKKLNKGEFDLEDFRQQMLQMQKMGGLKNLLSKLPGIGAGLPPEMSKLMDERVLAQYQAMIDSMTPDERRYPAKIKGRRRARICRGSGTELAALNRLLKQFTRMQKMIKKMGKRGGMQRMMQDMGQMMGGDGKGPFPPTGGGFPF